MMKTSLREEILANGLLVTFHDESNRYFGDYHRVCVVATLVCDVRGLSVEGPDDEALRSQAIEQFGDQLCVAKRLERMAVPSASVAVVRKSLIDDFLRHSSAYLSRPGYPHFLVRAELRKRSKHRCYG